VFTLATATLLLAYAVIMERAEPALAPPSPAMEPVLPAEGHPLSPPSSSPLRQSTDDQLSPDELEAREAMRRARATLLASQVRWRLFGSSLNMYFRLATRLWRRPCWRQTTTAHRAERRSFPGRIPRSAKHTPDRALRCRCSLLALFRFSTQPSAAAYKGCGNPRGRCFVDRTTGYARLLKFISVFVLRSSSCF
jgi:hypothetical protein